MLAIISPAKTLDYQSPLPNVNSTQAELTEYSAELIHLCRQLAPSEIASLMKISDKLAGLNAARFEQWEVEHHSGNARPAIFAFKGDVYTGLNIDSFSTHDIEFAQQHLRILSGLYGLLKPLDLIQPYRLEMGTKLTNKQGKDLYHFWGNIITQHLQFAIDSQQDNILINLASDEYYKSIQSEKLNAQIIKPVFLDRKNGQYKVISFYAKQARGLMCRFLIQYRITQVEQLKTFDLAGYWFDEANSTETEFIFKRDSE